MKSKKIFLFLVMLIAFLGIITLSTKVNAATISDNGKYSLLLTANEMDGCFDGEYAKLVRFNISEWYFLLIGDIYSSNKVNLVISATPSTTIGIFVDSILL